MAVVELTPSQRRILTALVNQYTTDEEPVKGREIAELVDRNPGTIRNQMQSLKALQLVEGVPGPKGGYRPTAEAYETLDIQQLDEPAEVPVAVDGELVAELVVENVGLGNVHHPELCRAEIHVQGSLQEVQQGDQVTVGPTPLHGLIVRGVADKVDTTENSLLLKVDEMETSDAGDE